MVQSAYDKRCEKEAKNKKLFTNTFNTGGLNQVLAKHGLRLTPNGNVVDNGCSVILFKKYLEDIVIPDIEKELGISSIKVHRKPTHVTKNLFQWYKATIKGE